MEDKPAETEGSAEDKGPDDPLTAEAAKSAKTVTASGDDHSKKVD